MTAETADYRNMHNSQINIPVRKINLSSVTSLLDVHDWDIRKFMHAWAYLRPC